MLEGKAKEMFEEWLKVHPFLGSEKYEREYLEVNIDGSLFNFNNIPDSMQWGVIQDWADSVGIYITLIPNWNKGIRTYRVGIHHEFGGIIDSLFLRPEKDSPFFIEYDTRQEAREAAITKLSELVNNKYK